MPICREVELPLRHPERGDVGTLHLRVPPRRAADASPPPLLDERGSVGDDDLAAIQLLEGEEYLYEVRLEGSRAGRLRLEPAERFDPDTDHGERGRLRPHLHTGIFQVSVADHRGEIGRARLEVRSRKLRYREHYRWMLRDLAEGFAELLMQRFAPSQQRFEVDESAGARTLYQRFAFLRSLLEGDVFDGAIQYILRRPYRTWQVEEEHRTPGRGMSATSAVARQLVGPGPRTGAGTLRETVGMETLPRELAVERSEETRDNDPNRFVRFAFERWRDVVARIHEALLAANDSGPVERGRRECEMLLDRLDAVLGSELFRACGRLQSFPAANQVLQKREGYRSVFRAYVQFEAAAALSWQGGERVYGAGQRNVATLYEYWVYYALAGEIAGLCHEPFDFTDLIEPSSDGLILRLEKGRRRVLSGKVRRLGRSLDVELWFNRSFPSTRPGSTGSWTRKMHPDCSLRIHSADPEAAFFYEEVWLHFDAKYRLDRLEEVFGEDDAREQDVEVAESAGGFDEDERKERSGEAKRADLLKMHAYRDAIRRSSGAYVVYPGDRSSRYLEYHELLPGLGAFPLRPTKDQGPEGAASLRRFVDRVLDHVALQTSQHERARYWQEKSYVADSIPDTRVETASFLREPPADAEVLLGFVKSEAHRRWIFREGLYNLRADDRTGSVEVGSEELGAPFLLLYGSDPDLPELRRVVGEPKVMDRAEMRRRGYPRPGSELYFCLEVGPQLTYGPVERTTSRELEGFHRRKGGGERGAPLVVRWTDLVEQIG